MLIDIEEQFKVDPVLARVAQMWGRDSKPARIGKGLYSVGHFNFDYLLPGGCRYHYVSDGDAAWISDPPLGEIEESNGYRYGSIDPYGVCDSPEQFMEHEVGKWIQSSDRKFVVSFTCVRRSEQPSEGGWRWHKWGGYIGKHDPRCEYLHDEDGIEEVYVFSIYERAT